MRPADAYLARAVEELIVWGTHGARLGVPYGHEQRTPALFFLEHLHAEDRDGRLERGARWQLQQGGGREERARDGADPRAAQVAVGGEQVQDRKESERRAAADDEDCRRAAPAARSGAHRVSHRRARDGHGKLERHVQVE